MHKQLMTLFTRTSLHVGAGASVGAIDQPVIRERHTRYPVIPGSSLKGVLADLDSEDNKGKRTETSAWLFGSDDNNNAFAGALLIGEARLLAFPVRSAKGCFAWLTCPLALGRFQRDTGAFPASEIQNLNVSDEEVCLTPDSVLVIGKQAVFEEYPLTVNGTLAKPLVDALKAACDDAVWQDLPKRLAVVSDGLFSYFVENACELAQHIKIEDDKGTVAKGALFNQENVPSETLFYTLIQSQAGKGAANKGKSAEDALAALAVALEKAECLLQVGADETTGLGWCSVNLKACK